MYYQEDRKVRRFWRGLGQVLSWPFVAAGRCAGFFWDLALGLIFGDWD